MALSKSQSLSSLSSIEQLVSTLGDQLDLTGEQIADVLWLILELQKFEISSVKVNPNLEDANSNILPGISNQTSDKSQVTEPITPTASTSKEESNIRKASEKQGSVYANSGSGGIQGLSIGVPDAPSLREPLKLAQALRPLMRRVETGKRLILDEAATVQRIAEERIFMPVLKAEPELWLDLALVIDESHSMLIWGHTIQELKEIFKKYGIFRDIRIWGLQPDETGNSLQVFSRMGSSKRLTDPKEIVDPTGRRLILIVSDCVSNIWRKGMMFPVLKMWTEKQPLTILQMLPEWMWRRTALDLGTAVGFKSSMMGVANQQLSLHKPLRRSRSIGFKVEDRSKIPVITLDWDKAAQWSQMLIGKADALVPGYLLPPELEIEEDISSSFLEKEDGAVSDLDATEIVKRFRMTTSPLGRELADLLAASPVINLPVVRLIQESLLPKSNQVQVAEVFLGGLLRPQSVSLEKLQSQESESKTILSPDSVEYEFIQPEIRDIFLDDAPISDSIDVVNAVSRYVAEQLGVSLSEFMAVLKAPQQAEEKQREDTIKPFAQITARVLRKLGGQYVQFAEELEQPVDKTISNTSEQKEIEQDISLSDELRTAMTIADEQEQAEVLSHLMARSPEAPSNLLNSLSTIEDETDRVSALIALVAHLPHSLLPNALEIVRNLQHTLSRFQGLAILATLLPEVVPEALQAALNITNESTLLRALTSLVEKLPVELLPQALQASLTIDDAFSRTRALIALVDKLPEAAPQALEAILSIESEDSRARALRELVPHLPVSFLPYTLEVVMAIQQENVRNDLLKDLRSFLPENLWHQPNVVAATSSRTPLWQEGDTQIYTLCTSTPWDLPLDVLVIPVGNRGGLGNFAVAFQEFLGIKPKWLTQVISNLIEAKKLKRIKPDQPLLVQIPFEINSQISSLVGFTSERFIICATSESENELSSNNTSIAYEAVVRLAVEQGFKRIVLPLIGTGVNRLPVDEVAEGMLRAINNVLKSHRSTSLEEITIVDRSADKIEIINRITHRLKEIDSFDNLESVIRNDSPENTLDNQSAQQNQPEKGENIKLLNTLIGHKDIILRMAWSPDGRFLASPSVDHTIRVWKPLDNQSSLILEGHNHGVNHVAWSPDGKTLASVSFDKTMRIWDVSTGNCLYTIEAHSEDIGTIAWSPGGRVLASGSVDTTIKLWDINTRQSLVTFQGHTKDVTRVSWSPDGQILASCSQDGTIRLWDTNTYKIRQTIKKSMNTGGIICISWSPNQKLLASASYRSIEIWSFNSQGEMVLKNQLKKLGSKYVSCVSFSPDGRLLASKEMDNRIRLFSCETWQEVKNFNEPSSSFWPVSLSFHPTQNILATLGQKDRVIRIWKLNINDLLQKC